MSIVVKGAKLPNNCGACPLRLAWCTERLYMVTRPERCPLEPERTGKWIPCKERNPDMGGWYIVTKTVSEDTKAVCLSWYSTLHGWEFDKIPDAWMPLPEPYMRKPE